MPSIADSMQLTRSDMAGFPEESVRYVLDLQKEKGWRATRSNRSHLALLSPDGKLRFGLSSSSSGLQYLKRDVDKYYKEKGEEGKKVEKKKVTEKYPCPRPDCNKTYASLEALNAHIGVDHEGKVVCAEEGCFELFNKPAAMGLHRSNKHGYQSPSYKQRKAQEAKRKANAEHQKVVSKEDQESIDINLSNPEKAIKAGLDDKLEESVKADSDETKSEVYEHPMDDIRKSVVEELKEKQQAHDNALGKVLHNIADGLEKDSTVEKDLDYIDERDSWTLDLDNISSYSVEDVIVMMEAAGLNLEIRVWKDK